MIASAAHGRRRSTVRTMIAASIIRRSASGSKTAPKRLSTRQRRAREPSVWAVTPATPEVTAAGQLRPVRADHAAGHHRERLVPPRPDLRGAFGGDERRVVLVREPAGGLERPALAPTADDQVLLQRLRQRATALEAVVPALEVELV